MKVSMLTGGQATRTIARLVRECIWFDVAVAWAGRNTVVDAMLTAHTNMRRVVIGTHMYQTDPAVLGDFMPHSAVHCLPPSGRLFHPKVYLFGTASGVSAVVGSHNLTGGAFGGGNIEVSLLLEGGADDAVFSELVEFVEQHWRSTKPIDEEFLYPYGLQYQLKRGQDRELHEFLLLKKPAPGARTASMELSWVEFVQRVETDGHHNVDGRLAILERAGALFKDKASLAAMDPLERKAIGGTYGTKEPRLDNLNWLWFGAMTGMGSFKKLISQPSRRLSEALDLIPLDVEVNEGNFDSFVAGFIRAFKDEAHKGGVPTATRLLAMKRPDVFVAVTEANEKGLAAAFSTAPTTLALDNYWARIIVPMQQSPWWRAPRPRVGLPAQIWDNRAALLDSIYYDPTAKKKPKAN